MTISQTQGLIDTNMQDGTLTLQADPSLATLNTSPQVGMEERTEYGARSEEEATLPPPIVQSVSICEGARVVVEG